MSEPSAYFDYLRGRSYSGFLYRKCWLYPRLAKRLSGRVLDVGCGIGDFMAFRRGTVGVDVNPYTIEWCQRRGLDARVMEADRLPFEDGSFDGVMFDNVLEHLSKPRALLAEICRVLAPDGRLLVGVPGERGFACDADHKVFYEEAELVRIMAEFSLDKVELFHMPLKSDWLAARISQYCLYGVFVRLK